MILILHPKKKISTPPPTYDDEKSASDSKFDKQI